MEGMDPTPPAGSSPEVTDKPQEQDIDLNVLFPQEESDLNQLFPDQEMKELLKKVSRNKKDLQRMEERFLNDDMFSPEGETHRPAPQKEEPDPE